MLLKGVACKTGCWVGMSSNFYIEFRSIIHVQHVCGFHVYRSVWTPVFGELLTMHLY